MTNRRGLKAVLGAALVVVVVLVGVLVFGGMAPGREDDLLNIAELPEEFMERYFDEYQELMADGDEENCLIVTSRGELADDYGAMKVVAAPNHQYILQYETEEAKNEAKEKFENDEMIAAVDNDDVIELDAAEYNSWGIEKMALDKVIEAVQGEDLPEVKVAVIDSGCDVDLVNKYYSDKIVEAYDVLNNTAANMQDTYGHGTHIAGIIAEGTPSNVKVVPLRVAEGRTMKISKVIAAINYAVYYGKADVINMSFGMYEYNTALYDAIEAASREKIVSVAAAGNDNTDRKAYPAAYGNTISIASVDAGLNKSSFSNYNEAVDFAAPGTGIKSTLSNMMTLSKGVDGEDDFEVLSGTSMAAPHAAGAVAILKSYNKELTRDAAVDLLRSYAARDLGEVGKDVYYGYGLIYLRPESLCMDAGRGDCEEFGVFKAEAKNVVLGIEVQDGLLTDRNYGTVNNLSPTRVEVAYADGSSLVTNLGDLREAEIAGYDANAAGEQTVVVEWQGWRATFQVNNPSDWESGWEYVPVDDKTAKLTGFTDFSHECITKKLYLPERIGQYEIVEVAGATNGYTIFDYANRSAFEEVVLPKTLTKISGSQTFSRFRTLEKVTSLAPALSITGNNVFGDDEKLTEVVGVIEQLGGSTFLGDVALRRVTLADDMTEIAANAFNGCSALEEIVLPRKLEVIGDFAFYGAGIDKVELPEGVKRIGEYAFANTDLKELRVPSSVEEIGNGALMGKDGYITIWTKTDDYAKEYAVENRIPYEAMNVSQVEVELAENKFKAFDKVQTDVYVYFDRGVNDGEYRELKDAEGRREVIKSDDVEIVYQSGDEGFRYGDDSFVVRGVTQYGERFEKTVAVTVEKKELSNNSTDYAGVYDGEGHSIKIDVGVDGYEIRYSVGNTDYDLTELPMFTEVGEYTVNYKISAEGYDDLEGANKVKIYGVKDFGASVVLKGDKLVVRDNDFDEIRNKIMTYAESTEYAHYSKNGEATTGALKTGDVIKVMMNGAQAYEYRVALLGDTSGDGKVNYLDYVNIYNHIQKAKHPELSKTLLTEEYLLAADVSGDGKVSYLDYVKVYNKIKEQKEGRN